MKKNKYDVVVIGGGPAGSVASSLLSKAGIDVLLLEKEKFPRYKVGESLIPHFWKYTDQIGATEAIEKEGFVKKAGGFVLWDDVMRTVSFKNFGFTRPALHVERDTFDNILLDTSKGHGTEVIEKAQVKGVAHTEEGCIVDWQDENREKRSVACRYVVDASGQAAVVSRQYDLIEYDSDFRFQAFWGYLDKSEYLNAKGEITDFSHRHDDPPMTLVSSTGDWGWAWQIVQKEKVSVGLIVPRNKLPEYKAGGETLNERFLTAIHNIPFTKDLLKNSSLVGNVRTIKDYAYTPTKMVHEHTFLAGDAAAFFDPINSEGITIAMYAGSLVAWAIENALKNPKREGFYKRTYEDQLNVRLDLFRLLAFPDEMIPEGLIDKITRSAKNQSNNENYLSLAQLMLTQRGREFPDLLKKLGLEEKEVYQEVPIPHVIESSL